MKKKFKIRYILLLLVAFSLNAFANEKYKSYNLRSPLDIPLYLSGNFAELRGGHFHAGLDFKTQGVIGKPIYAVADGYVSRINVSTGGYGRALYIDHPELGLTTVYAHSHKYIPAIDSIAKSYHYAQEKYNINVFPDERYYVKKGQIIAYSGNTGSSAGPHLHFETRDLKTQDPINPLFFGFDVKDTKAPSINGLRIYPIDNNGVVAGQSDDSKFYSIVYYSGKYHLKNNPTINVWGKLGFAVSVIDYLDDSWSKCGIYTIELFVDSTRIYKQEMDRFSYSETRFIDAHIDQEVRAKHRVDYQYSFKAKPNNPLSIYKEMLNDGVVDFSDSAQHLISYKIKDTYGNTSVLEFKVNSVKQDIAPKSDEKLLKWEEAHQYSTNQVKLEIPARAFYEDQSLDCNVINDSKYLAPIFKIDNKEKPLNKKATISIRPYDNDTMSIDKMVICKISDSGNLSPLATTKKDGVLSTSTYGLANYTVSCDTIAPSITPVNIANGKRFDSVATFGFKVKDDFTGIWDYTATIDGNWALFYYEYKQDYVYYTIDPKRLTKGQNHQLEFEVWDAVGNKVTYSGNFYW